MWWRSLLAASIVMIVTGVSLMLWQKRGYRTSPAAAAAMIDLVSVPNLYPGGSPPANMPPPGTHIHEDFSGGDVSEGKRLWSVYNCIGCHANGGGGIGVALMDDKWLYGSEPRNIFASIVEGRPNGMPSFRGKIPDAQVWQLVAYVRSMSGQVPVSSRSSRNDDISSKKEETMQPKEPTHPHGEKKP